MTVTLLILQHREIGRLEPSKDGPDTRHIAAFLVRHRGVSECRNSILCVCVRERVKSSL